MQELPVTLEVVHARQTHAITVLEEIGRTVARLDQEFGDKLAEIRHERNSLRDIARSISESTVKLLTARAVLAAVPPTSRLIVLFSGAALGAFGATFLWFSLYAAPAVAAVVK